MIAKNVLLQFPNVLEMQKLLVSLASCLKLEFPLKS